MRKPILKKRSRWEKNSYALGRIREDAAEEDHAVR